MGRNQTGIYHIPVIIKNRGIFPILCCGYLWKSEYITAIRKFKGKWILVAISGVLLWAIPNYMIPNEMGIAIFRGNHGYQLCGLTDPQE